MADRETRRYNYSEPNVGLAGSGDPAFTVLKAACPHAALILTQYLSNSYERDDENTDCSVGGTRDLLVVRLRAFSKPAFLRRLPQGHRKSTPQNRDSGKADRGVVRVQTQSKRALLRRKPQPADLSRARHAGGGPPKCALNEACVPTSRNIASMVAASGRIVTIPEKIARSPMLSSIRKAGR